MQSLTLENMELPREANMFVPNINGTVTVKLQVITLSLRNSSHHTKAGLKNSLIIHSNYL